MRIVGLLIVVVIIGYLFTQYNGQFLSQSTTITSEDISIAGVLDDARTAAGQMEGKDRGDMVVVYDGVSVPKSSTVLNLAGRGLTGSLKAEVRQLSELAEMDLSDNQFTGLPVEVGQLTKLKRLNLSNNPLTGLPHELGNLKALEILDLRGTNYSESDLATIKASLPKTTKIVTD
ncbi:MAG: hypothetical protein RLZZ360_731 [Candidatus Parcubacteria bacterium]|jgi:Leucine-rich repeat (LRR) protein